MDFPAEQFPWTETKLKARDSSWHLQDKRQEVGGGGGGVFVGASTAVLVVGDVDLAFAYNECLFEVEYIEKRLD